MGQIWRGLALFWRKIRGCGHHRGSDMEGIQALCEEGLNLNLGHVGFMNFSISRKDPTAFLVPPVNRENLFLMF